MNPLEVPKAYSETPRMLDDRNSSVLPLFDFSAGSSTRRNEIVVDRVVNLKREYEGAQAGRIVWRVTGHPRLGLPGRYDQDVYVALLEMVRRRGGMPADGEMHFSVYEIIGLVGRWQSGETYESVRTSLRRMAATVVMSDKAWWSPRTGSYVSRTFTLYWLELAEHQNRAGRRAESHKLSWHPLVVESHDGDYVTPLNFDVYRQLTSPVSRRLYRLLTAFGQRKERGYPLIWDAYELRDLIPLAPYRYISQIERALTQAHSELLDVGLCDDIVCEKDSRGAPIIAYGLRRDMPPEVVRAVERLAAEGVRRRRAETLVDQYGPRHCSHWADLLHRQKGIVPQKRGGLLAWAIVKQPEWWTPDSIELGTSNMARDAGTEPQESEIVKAGESRAEVGGEKEPKDVACLAPVSDEHDDWLNEPDAGSAKDSRRPPSEGEIVWETLVAAMVSGPHGGDLPEWFGFYVEATLSGSKLLVRLPSADIAEETQRHYGSELSRIWREQKGSKASVQFYAPGLPLKEEN